MHTFHPGELPPSILNNITAQLTAVYPGFKNEHVCVSTRVDARMLQYMYEGESTVWGVRLLFPSRVPEKPQPLSLCSTGFVLQTIASSPEFLFLVRFFNLLSLRPQIQIFFSIS